MNLKKWRIIILIILSAIIIYPKIENKINLNHTILMIKENYVNEEEEVKNINKQYIKKLYKDRNRNSEEEFILGYINDEYSRFDTAYAKIDYNTDDFVKYYLYNTKAKENIEKDNINQAKIFTKKALDNTQLNRYNKSYYLIWKALIEYIDVGCGREYIVANTQKMIEKSRIDENTYMLRKHMLPVLILIGDTDQAIQNILQVIFLAKDINDVYSQVKSIIDLAMIFTDMEGYEHAMETLNNAFELSDSIENKEDKFSMQLYIYINQCRIYFLTHRFEDLKSVITKIYNMKGYIDEDNYNDFLILAKAYDSIYMCYKNKLQSAEKLLDESKSLLEKDENILLSDKEITIKLAYIKLEYSKKNYELSISMCKELLQKLKYNHSFGYKLIVMEQLQTLLILTKNDEISKLNEEIEKYNYEIKNNTSRSYFKNSLSEYKNIKSINKRYNSNIKILQLVIIQLIIIIIIIMMYKRKQQKNELLKKDIRILNNQFEYQLSHYENIKRYQNEVRLLWHDMKNHLNTIIGLANSGDLESLKKYLYKLDENMINSENKAITKNKVLDAILANKIQRCELQKIDINIDVKLPENIGIEDIDICIIFGNLIDNAIEACNNISDKNIKKYINIKCGLKNNNIYIKIENSKQHKVSKIGNKFITSKSDKLNHGLGIKSIRNSVEKYNGDFKISYEESKFIVFIIIKRGS